MPTKKTKQILCPECNYLARHAKKACKRGAYCLSLCEIGEMICLKKISVVVGAIDVDPVESLRKAVTRQYAFAG